MRLADIKPGSLIKKKEPGVWTDKYTRALIIGVYQPAEPDKLEQVWLRFDNNGVYEYDTRSKATIAANWEYIPPFFQIGSEYVANGATFYVMDVYQVDNPINEQSRVVAIAKATYENGDEMIVPLNQVDYERMVK